MYKFIYAKHRIHPKIDRYHEQWYCLIDTIESLMQFIELRSNKLCSDYMYIKNKRAKGDRSHLCDNQQIAIETVLTLNENRETLLDDIKYLDKFTQAYIDCFNDWGSFVVSPNYAFRDIDSTFEILEERYNEQFVFPDNKNLEMKITKWPGGKHYYAKIGDIEVVDDDGNKKWPTYKRAEEEVSNFKIRNNI